MTDPLTLKLADNIGAARGTDYFLMKEQLTKEEQDLLYRVRKFAEQEVLPIVNPYWERGEFPFELIPKLAAQQIVGDHNLGDHGCTRSPPAWRVAGSS
jgi:glutaryl-CoA dehydrogenase